jgi:8-oxo-dGTP diphosphatase
LRERLTARVMLFDPQGSILLMKGRLPSAPDSAGGWFTVGGGLEPGEDVQSAAAREVFEETGLSGVTIGPAVGFAEQVHHDRKGRPVLAKETFVIARCAGGRISRKGWQALETEFVDDIRWWTLADLEACGDAVFPADLPLRIRAALAHPFIAGD